MEIFQFNINLQAKLTCVKARDRHTLLYYKYRDREKRGSTGEGRETESVPFALQFGIFFVSLHQHES